LAKIPLGVRLNNPGNIEHGQEWKGLAPATHKRFCSFEGPEWGIRAIHKTLQTYQNVHNLTTIRQFINRWAPSVENDTESYVEHVDKIAEGVTADEPLDIMDPQIAFDVVTGIIAHENSNYKYKDIVVWNGLILAGVEMPEATFPIG